MKKLLVFIAVLMMSYTVNAERIISDVTEGNTRTITCNYEPISEYVSVSLSTKVVNNNIYYNYLNFLIFDKNQDFEIKDNYNEKLDIILYSGRTFSITKSAGLKVEGNNKKYKIDNKLLKLYNIYVSFIVTDTLDQMLSHKINSISLCIDPYLYLIQNASETNSLVKSTKNINNILVNMNALIEKALK